MLLDRLVCGCNDRRMQTKLLAEADLNFDSALKLVQAMESAEKGAKQMQDTPSTIQVVQGAASGKQKAPPRQNSSVSCYRCGGKHSPSICKFKNVDCNYCGKQGHIAKVCYSKERDQKRKHKHNKQQKTTHQLSSNVNPETEEYTMYHASTDRAPKPLKVTLQINSADVQMEIDTGATFSVISEETYSRLWPHQVVKLLHFDTELCKIRTLTTSLSCTKFISSIVINLTFFETYHIIL